MDPSLSSTLLLCSALLSIVAVGWLYFRRVRVDRPPVGVFNLRDVVFVFIVLVVIPPLYLQLPLWVVGTILVVMGSGLTYFTLTSALGARVAVVLVLALATAEVALTTTGHGQATAFTIVNDVAVGVLVVGVCNIWAQSGLHARDVAVFAAAVTAYDLIATGFLPVMVEFFTKVQALPFAPMVAFGHGSATAGIGMGDLLFTLLWPLVAYKAYSRRAGLLAAVATLACGLGLAFAFYFDLLNLAVPAMVVIGPVMLAQYWWLHRRYGDEQTAGAYEAASRSNTPTPAPAPLVPTADLLAALALTTDPAEGPYLRYVAVHDGKILSSGTDPGDVVRQARRQGSSAPVLVLTSVDPDPAVANT